MKASEMLKITQENNIDEKSQAVVDELIEQMKLKAILGERSFTTRSIGEFGKNIDSTKLQLEVLKKLRLLGYKAEHKCEFRQLADAWLEVSW